MLRTNTDLNPLEAMLRYYKQMWTVEQTFRAAKHLSRPGREHPSDLGAAASVIATPASISRGPSSFRLTMADIHRSFPFRT